MPYIRIYKDGICVDTIDVGVGSNLLKVLIKNSYNLSAQCNGKGICGKCKVIVKNASSKIASIEKAHFSMDEIKRGIRLACMVDVFDDVDVYLLDKSQSDARILNDLYKNDFIVDSDIIIKKVNIDQPDLQNQKDYLSLLEEKLSAHFCKITPDELNKLYHLKDKPFYCVIYKDEILDIRQDKKAFGIAFDIGTTTVVAYFVSLVDGQIIDNFAFVNPQQRFGADVISRIDYTIENKNGIKLLQNELIEAINHAIGAVVKRNGVEADDIYKMVFVGNTTMLHLLLGVHPRPIATSPFSPVFLHKVELKPHHLNIDANKNAIVKVLDGIFSYVGADIVAGIITTEIHKKDEICLLLDIGTNGEMVLGSKDFLLACSTAAGPAFEGVNLSCGMSAIEGAIDSVSIKNGKVLFSTIGNKKATGICGSGIIQAISCMLDEGIIDQTGRFDQEGFKAYKSFFKDLNSQPAFFITDNVYITQKDIRQIQLAKASVAAGVKVMLKIANIEVDSISDVFLSGGFGNYLDPYAAIRIGLIDKKLSDKIKPVGNAAGNGAVLALLNRQSEGEFAILKEKVRYIELSNLPEFSELFVEHMVFD